LTDQNKDGILSNLVQCPKCNRFLSKSQTLASHQRQCSPEMIDAKRSHRYKLPFLSYDVKKIYIDVDTIMLTPNELHHVIPVVSRVYDILEKLNIRTSLIQILAQDPKYQKTLDILESENMVDNFFTYHLYLYIVQRLLPYLKSLSYEKVNTKLIPIFTVIRSEKGESSKDVTGFNEDEEIDKRLADCPDCYKNKVQQLVSSFSEEHDEGRKVEEYMKNGIHNGTEKFYVIRCLDVKRSVYKDIRRFVDQKKDEDGDTRSTRRDFVYGREDRVRGWSLTNIPIWCSTAASNSWKSTKESVALVEGKVQL
jgi:hypothetical protein